MSKNKTRLIRAIFNKYLAVFMMMCLVTSLVPSTVLANEGDGGDVQTTSEQTVTEAPAEDAESCPAPAPVVGYNIAWVNYNGALLELDCCVPYGTMPSYDGETPTKPATKFFTFKFVGWYPCVHPVIGPHTYWACFVPVPRTYTVTWVNADGNVLEVDEGLKYGAKPSYDGETPTLASDAQYDYEFAGWTPKVSCVTGDATYTANYTKTLRSYTVTWVDDDGTTQLEVDENVPFGTDPSYDGETPTKASTAQYDYEFAGWDPEVNSVEGDATYRATYTAITRTYKLTYDLAGGTLDGKTGTFDEFHPYGEVINLAAAPTRDGYTFQYWKGSQYEAGAEYKVTEDHTFTAVWEKNSDNKKGDNKNGDNKQSGNKQQAAKKTLPRTGDDFNSVIPFVISFFGAMLLVFGYVLRRRSQHSNR